KKLVKRLHELRQQKLTRDQLLIKLGAARTEAGPVAYRIIDIQLPGKDQPVTAETFCFKLNWQKLREARRREGSYLLRSNLTGGDPAKLWAFYLSIGGDRAGLQRTQGGPGNPPDLPPNRRAHRSPHLRGIPGLLSAGDAQAAAAVPGAGADATVGVGEDGRNPDGRHAPADHRWAHGPAVALHRARTGPVDPAPPVEDRLARSAVTQDCLGRRCRAMTPPCVVPTFRPYAAENLEFGGFYASSCESRVTYQLLLRRALAGSVTALTSPPVTKRHSTRQMGRWRGTGRCVRGTACSARRMGQWRGNPRTRQALSPNPCAYRRRAPRHRRPATPI